MKQAGLSPHPSSQEAPQDPLVLLSDIREYGFAARLEILQARLGFLPTGHQEANDAFELWYNQELDSETAEDMMAKIADHQEKASNGDPEKTIANVVTRYGSYARQSYRDFAVLLQSGREVRTYQPQGDPTLTLERVFRDTPAYHGPGQFVRHRDLTSTAQEGTWQRLGFDPYTAEVRKIGSASAGVIDSYTSGSLQPALKSHLKEVLSGTLASDAEVEFEAAAADQENRMLHWTDRLTEARRNAMSNSLATAALAHLPNIRPEFSQQ